MMLVTVRDTRSRTRDNLKTARRGFHIAIVRSRKPAVYLICRIRSGFTIFLRIRSGLAYWLAFGLP
jgi:antitoxin (DNA-binding transcriptional repressor) of toxin-antitoxin stability system